MQKRILRLPDVQAKTGLKHAEIYDRMSRGEFPRAVPLGVRARGWLEHEIDAWIDELAAERDGGANAS